MAISNSSAGRAAMDGGQLWLMFARALVVAVAFALVCVAVLGGAGLWLWQQLHQRPDLWSVAAAVAAGAELMFAWAWLAKYHRLNAQPDDHRPKHPSFHPRQAFDKFVVEQHRISRWICIHKMICSWFGDVPFEAICEGNMAELITYGFFFMSTAEYETRYGQPALHLVRELEHAWRVRFRAGHNPALGFMAHLWQPIRAHYRPLAFYAAIELLFLFKHCVMLAMGFRSASVHGLAYYTYDPTDELARRRMPVLFLHGVGLGLLPYTLFVARLACMGRPVAVLECAHLGMRWVPHVPCADEVVEALVALLRGQLRWARVCVAGHSYGTFYASRLLQLHPGLVDSLCLCDPVTIGMFTGKLITNFVYTPGGTTGNLLMWWVARDLHHAASVCRNFFWSCLELWPDQLPARTLMVLSDADELVPVREILAMVEHEAPHVRLLRHPKHQHANFLFDLPWQRQITQHLAELLDGDPGQGGAATEPGSNGGSRTNSPPAMLRDEGEGAGLRGALSTGMVVVAARPCRHSSSLGWPSLSEGCAVVAAALAPVRGQREPWAEGDGAREQGSGARAATPARLRSGAGRAHDARAATTPGRVRA